MPSYPLVVGAIMTAIPETIDARASTATAVARMRELDIRHLPVMAGDELVGILSQRDLERARAFLDAAPGVVGPNVGDLCTRTLLTVELDAPLDAVATQMADHKLGSALVLDEGELVGIVTNVDMYRCLADLVVQLQASQS